MGVDDRLCPTQGCLRPVRSGCLYAQRPGEGYARLTPRATFLGPFGAGHGMPCRYVLLEQVLWLGEGFWGSWGDLAQPVAGALGSVGGRSVVWLGRVSRP